jgi:hypothetical protein
VEIESRQAQIRRARNKPSVAVIVTSVYAMPCHAMPCLRARYDGAGRMGLATQKEEIKKGKKKEFLASRVK